MALAIFGITNSGLNLAATLVLLLLIVVWLALIVYTFLDARRRISDPFLVACATIASFFPYIGTIIYTIVRPPEFLEDAHERELEIKAAELRVRQLREQSCPNCEYPVEKNYLRCPNCQRRLKDPCPTCGEPVDPRWSLCPYCETALAGERSQQPRRRGRRPEEERERERDRELAEVQPRPRNPDKKRRSAAAEGEKSGPARSQSSGARKGGARSASKEAPTSEQKQRSPRREPDPDPRQA
ncbi:MAG TPA: zinc ribbon domain-containing protein [Solirubrobacterales bacterium]|nr:zinc ribbon domain-containing protein [Solirubrobacterales bacterium]